LLHRRRARSLLILPAAVACLVLPRPGFAAGGCSLASRAGAASSPIELPVTKRKLFVLPGKATDRALVFGPYQVMQYRPGLAKSRSHSSSTPTGNSYTAEGSRRYSFELDTGEGQRLAVECRQAETTSATAESGTDREQTLSCTVAAPAGGTWALDYASGEGVMHGRSGSRYLVAAGGAIPLGRARCSDFLVTGQGGKPVLSLDFDGKGRVELAAELPAEERHVLAALASALYLADLRRQH
jgi:hypothetical protein